MSYLKHRIDCWKETNILQEIKLNGFSIFFFAFSCCNFLMPANISCYLKSFCMSAHHPEEFLNANSAPRLNFKPFCSNCYMVSSDFMGFHWSVFGTSVLGLFQTVLSSRKMTALFTLHVPTLTSHFPTYTNCSMCWGCCWHVVCYVSPFVFCACERNTNRNEKQMENKEGKKME